MKIPGILILIGTAIALVGVLGPNTWPYYVIAGVGGFIVGQGFNRLFKPKPWD